MQQIMDTENCTLSIHIQGFFKRVAYINGNNVQHVALNYILKHSTPSCSDVYNTGVKDGFCVVIIFSFRAPFDA